MFTLWTVSGQFSSTLFSNNTKHQLYKPKPEMQHDVFRGNSFL